MIGAFEQKGKVNATSEPLRQRLKAARARRAAELRRDGLTFTEIRKECQCQTTGEARSLVGRGERLLMAEARALRAASQLARDTEPNPPQPMGQKDWKQVLEELAEEDKKWSSKQD